MFNLIAVKDTVPVAPKTFGLDPATAIHDALNKKFANKLIQERGLALSVYDVLTAEDGRVTWGNGQMYYKTSFRLLMFAPFLGEVLVGKVLSTTPRYIRVSLGFFTDIYVLRTLLPPNSTYDANEKRFFWYPGDEGAGALDEPALQNTLKAERFYFDSGEPIRFRIESVEWHENEPGPPQAPRPEGGEDEAEGDEDDDPLERAPYRIVGTVAEQGLGIVSWWGEGGEEGEEGEGGEMQE